MSLTYYIDILSICTYREVPEMGEWVTIIVSNISQDYNFDIGTTVSAKKYFKTTNFDVNRHVLLY